MNFPFWKRAIRFFFPQLCRACGVLLPDERLICAPCDSRVRRTGLSRCTRCGAPFESAGSPHPCAQCLKDPPPFNWHYSPVLYEDRVPGLIHRLKYGSSLDLPDLFADWCLEGVAGRIEGADFLIPVPASKGRLKGRGYNQSVLIAKALSNKIGIPVLARGLRKNRETRAQTRLTREERAVNLKGAFDWRGAERLEGKKVVLVDDIYSTGSTLAECARALSGLKPAEIGAVTVAFNRLRR